MVEAPDPPGPILFTDIEGYSLSTMSYGPEPDHLADLYMPAEADRVFRDKTPLILYVHGGSWILGSRKNKLPGPIIALTKKGWAVASVDYRLVDDSIRAPTQQQDVARALVWFKSNASRLGLDPDVVVLAGHSSGGHLAALVGLGCDRNGGTFACAPELNEFVPLDGSADPRPEVLGIITFGAVFDIATWAGSGDMASKAVTKLIGCTPRRTCTGDEVDFQQPLGFLDPTDPPMYVYHAVDDDVVPWPSQAAAAVDAMEENFRDRSSTMVWFDSGASGGHLPGYANSEAIARFVEMARRGTR